MGPNACFGRLGVTKRVIFGVLGGADGRVATRADEEASQDTCFVDVRAVPATSTNGFGNGLHLALVYGVLWHLRQTLKEMYTQ